MRSGRLQRIVTISVKTRSPDIADFNENGVNAEGIVSRVLTEDDFKDSSYSGMDRSHVDFIKSFARKIMPRMSGCLWSSGSWKTGCSGSLLREFG